MSKAIKKAKLHRLKSETLTIRVTPAVKLLAEAGAKRESRSLANYVARLIEKDAKATSR